MAAMRLAAIAMLVATTAAHADDEWPADRNGRIAAEIAACAKDRAAVCLDVATELEHAGIASRLGYTPAKLRERATTLYEDQCTAGSADARSSARLIASCTGLLAFDGLIVTLALPSSAPANVVLDNLKFASAMLTAGPDESHPAVNARVPELVFGIGKFQVTAPPLDVTVSGKFPAIPLNKSLIAVAMAV